MMRGLFYCQHLLGIGHLTRSLALCQGLVELGPVGFIQGGPDVKKAFNHPRLLTKTLSPLMMEESTSQLYSTEGYPLEDAFKIRSQQIEDFVEHWGRIDYIVVELFPFGRKKFKSEIFFLLELVKSLNPHCKIFTSVRDILVSKPDQLQRDVKIANWINQYFDAVLVHSDEALIRLEDSFSQVNAIERPIYYTGFVCDSTPVEDCIRQPRIVVTAGGGIVGEELVDAVLSLSEQLKDFEILIPIGPNTPLHAEQRWSDEAQKHANVFLSPFLDDFENILASSQLSISLAGYNTAMNILKTKTPSLMLPYLANNEQSTRATALQALGFVEILEPESLRQEILLAKIRERLCAGAPKETPNLFGVENTRTLVQMLLKGASL